MGIELARAYVLIRADSSKLAGDLGKTASKVTNSLKGVAKSAGAPMSAASVAAQKLGRSLAAAKNEAESFKKSMGKTQTALKGVTKAAGRTAKATAKVKSGLIGVGTAVRGLVAAAGIYSLGRAIFAAGNQAMTFEKTMIDVRANARLLGKDGAAAFEMLEKTARKMGATTAFSATEAAAALNQLVLGGLRAEQAAAALPSVLNLAASANLGLAEAAKATVDNMVKFGMAASDTARIGDTLSSAQSRAQVTARDLIGGLQATGAAASSMGIDFEDVVAVLTAFGKVGIDQGRAGTSLALGLARMAAPPAEAAKALKELNISMSDFQKPGGGIDLIGLLKALALALPEDEIKRMTAVVDIFGARGRAIVGVLKLMKETAFVSETRQGFIDDMGRAAVVAEAKMETFWGSIRKVRSVLGELAIAGLTPVLEALKPLLEMVVALTGWIAKLVGHFEALSPIMTVMMATLTGLAIAALAWVVALKAVAVAKMAILAMSGPAGWAMIAVGLGIATAATIALNSDLEDTKEKVKGILDEAKGATKDGKSESASRLMLEEVPDSEDATAAMKDLNEEIFRIRNNLTEAQIDVRDFMQTMEPSDEQLRKFKLMRKELEGVQEAAEAKEEFKKAGEKFIKSMKEKGEQMRLAMRTPVEVLREEAARVRKLLRASVISQETAGRKITQLRKTEMESRAGGQRFGFREMGRHIQDAIMKKGVQLDQKRNQLMEKQIVVQQEIVKAVTESGDRWEA